MASADVIAAVATAPGRGGIGVVRVSGSNLDAIINGLLGAPVAPRHAQLHNFLDATGQPIDQGIALYFPAPHSYTGEAVLELQGHGGPAVLQMLLQRCLDLGARLAEPGEFTRRAFLNDKLDLAQAESVADLIDATTAQAARLAMRSLQGAFSEEVHALVRKLTDLRLLVEATLDFPEEEIDLLRSAEARRQLEAIQVQVGKVLQASRQGSLLREGIHVVLVGRPNVGKSSLLNRLAGAEVAIVTDTPGTTRDAIRQAIQIEGVPLHIIDTAGLRDSADPVEKIGMARTWMSIEQADVVLLLMDASHGEDVPQEIFARLPKHLPLLRVYNKIDLLQETPSVREEEGVAEIRLSAQSGAGLDLLRHKLLQMAGWQGGEALFMARERHVRALRETQQHLACAGENWQQLELLAEELRLAQDALSAITGKFTADDLLGEIFSRFCIGK
ncbi:MAG: tRNA uridine-5-carboxymethylaminomethyl(34) synthesis GTPase MnmE [Pseudomonadota bacterium]